MQVYITSHSARRRSGELQCKQPDCHGSGVNSITGSPKEIQICKNGMLKRLTFFHCDEHVRKPMS